MSLQKELQGLNLTVGNPKTADLDFEEFSYVDDQGTFGRIDAAWLELLCEYLEKHYQAQSVAERLPYLAVWCKDTVPLPSERPFMIAGLLAVWLVQGNDKYPQDMDLGDMGRSEDKRRISLEPNLLGDLKIFVISKAKTLSSIMNQHFPEALAISYINHRIIVEFTEIDDEQHQTRLDSLPRAISKTDVALRYHNGPIYAQDKPFRNPFLDLNGSAGSVLHSDDLRTVNESFWIDNSSVTGLPQQQLASNGKRVYKASNESSKDFNLFIQGIYATSASELKNRQLQIRDPSLTLTLATSATPLVRKQLPRGEITGGEIAGFMHGSDIQFPYDGGRLLCFADAVDGLVEGGWEVGLSAPEKRKAGAAGLDDDLGGPIRHRNFS